MLEIKIVAEYIALLHVPYFLKSPLAISAPRQDRNFWVVLQAYKSLTEEVVCFGLFDETL